MLGTFRVVAGDFKPGKEHQFLNGTFTMKREDRWRRESIKIEAVDLIETADEENVKRLGGTIGWGVAGAALLGPVGALAGLIAGGRGKDVTFVCKLKDGRKFIGVASTKLYIRMTAPFVLQNA